MATTQIQLNQAGGAAPAPQPKSKMKVSPLVAGYITLGVIGGGSFVSLYGIVLTFLVQTIPDTSVGQPPLSDEQQHQRKLKQTMVGLTAIIGMVGIIFGIITGAKTKGPLQAGIFVALFAAISAFFLISTSITYTQDARITGKFEGTGATPKSPDKRIKTGTEIGLIVSAIATAGFGGGLAAIFLKNKDAILGGSKKIGAQLKQAAASKAAAKYIVQKQPAGAPQAHAAKAAVAQSAQQHAQQVKRAAAAATPA